MRTEQFPPQNLTAEQGVLGSILLDNAVADDVLRLLRADDFYHDGHQKLYRAMRTLLQAGGRVDSLLLADELVRTGAMDEGQADEAIGTVLDATPHAGNGAYYAEIVRRKAILRRLIDSAHETLAECYRDDLPAEDVLASAERRVFEVAEDRAVGDVHRLGDVLVEVMAEFERREAGHFSGVLTGFRDLDGQIDGLRNSQVVILAARPGLGKSALALAIADNVTHLHGKDVLFVSLEMSRLELGERLLASHARVDASRLRKAQTPDRAAKAALGRSYALLGASPIHIDDTPSRTLSQVAAAARRIARRGDLGLVIVDYLQLLRPEAGDSRQEEVAAISRRLKELAKEIDRPILALCQINRQAEQREDKKPRMADLRESGAIEQDADVVILLHRPDYYNAADRPGLVECIVAKNRGGPVGTVRLTFVKEYTRFEDWSEPIGAGPAFQVHHGDDF